MGFPLDDVIGQTINQHRSLTDEELESYPKLWTDGTRDPMGYELDNGNLLVPASDPAFNRPGWFVSMDSVTPDVTGKTVKTFRRMTDEELETFHDGWYGSEINPLCLECEDGSVLIPAADPERNGPGVGSVDFGGGEYTFFQDLHEILQEDDPPSPSP